MSRTNFWRAALLFRHLLRAILADLFVDVDDVEDFGPRIGEKSTDMRPTSTVHAYHGDAPISRLAFLAESEMRQRGDSRGGGQRIAQETTSTKTPHETLPYRTRMAW